MVNALRVIVKDAGRREEVRGQYNGHGSILGARAGIRKCFRCGKGTRSVLYFGSEKRAEVTARLAFAVGEGSEDTMGNVIERVGHH